MFPILSWRSDDMYGNDLSCIEGTLSRMLAFQRELPASRDREHGCACDSDTVLTNTSSGRVNYSQEILSYCWCKSITILAPLLLQVYTWYKHDLQLLPPRHPSIASVQLIQILLNLPLNPLRIQPKSRIITLVAG